VKEQEQINISYIGDLNYNIPHDTFIIQNDKDYINVCKNISSSQVDLTNIEILVKNKIHFIWLKDFIDQIKIPSSFNEMTARILLGDKWNVNLPDWLLDEDIIDQKLLELDIDYEEKEIGFGDKLLSDLLEPNFKNEVLAATALVDIIKAIINKEKNILIEKYPVLKQCLKNKYEEWSQNSNKEWARETSYLLSKDIKNVWYMLSIWSCLYSYPQKLLEYVLTPEQATYVKKVPITAVKDIQMEPEASEQVITQIDLFFNEIMGQVSTSEEFQKVIEYTSGILSKEFDYILQILKSKSFSPTKEDIKKVYDKFKSCPGLSESKLYYIYNFIEPDFPTLISSEENWDSAKWINWTVKEYIPYRKWQINNQKYDEELEKTITRFSDWVINEYPSIHKNTNLSLIHFLRIISSSENNDELSIILLVDCLPITFERLLNDIFVNIGFMRNSLEYRFASLPTTTKYNKPFLISGEWQDNETSAEVILHNRSKKDWNNKQVIYINNLKAFSEIQIPDKPSIIFFNFLDVDELLHSDIELKNTSYEEEIMRFFKRAGESLDRLSKEWAGQKEKFSIYIVTDHGAGRILEEEKCSFDSKIINKIFTEEKHRYAEVEEKHVNDIPDNLWKLGYKFKIPFLSDNKVFFLPKGHNTVRKAGRIKGYMHGGITPEEVIVPVAQYKLVRGIWKKPYTRFLNLDLDKKTGKAKFYIQRVVTLEIEIKNTNPFEINILRVSIRNPKADIKNFETVKINVNCSDVLTISCYFEKSALQAKNLEIEILYESDIGRYTDYIKINSEFKSAVSGGFDLKKL